MRDIYEILASNWVFSGSGYLVMSVKFYSDQPWSTKFGPKLVIPQLICKISRRFLHLTVGFRGRAIERCQSNSTTTHPGCHSNEIWVKIGYNSACTTNISDILASTGGLRGRVIEQCQSNSSASHTGCHGNDNWAQTGLNSACMRYISQILKSSKGFHSRAIKRS